MRTMLSRQQTLMVGGLCATYGLFYLGRVNISVVLPLLAVELNVGRAEVGILGTVFFWTYAFGNFLWGEVGNHVRPFYVIGFGLLASALVNLAFGFQATLAAMLLLWAINGLAQAGGWSPMARILAERLDPAHIKRVSTVLPFSYVSGTVITWALIGAVASGVNWRAAFWLPGVVLLLATAAWWKAGIDAPRRKSSGVRLSVIIGEARGVAFALLVAAFSGFVRNGSIIWLPSFILDTGVIPDNLVGAVAALTQALALAGIFLARWGVMRSNQVFLTAMLLFGAGGLAFLLLTLTGDLLSIVVIAIALMMLNGGFGMVTSALPLLLASPGRASSIAGTLNMMATFAGGLAGFSIGGLVEFSGWGAVFVLWGVCLLLTSLLFWRHRDREDARDLSGAG